MRILLADKLHPTAVEAFEKLPGVEVVNRPELAAEDLPAHLEEVDVLVVRSTRVTAAALDRAPRLGLVIRAGSGVNTIDVEHASSRGIYVANCPGKNAVAVAELTVGLLLALDRRLPDNVLELRRGRWNKKEYARGDGLKGKSVGVVGTGTIGREVIARLRPFEVELRAWSRSLTPERAASLGVGYCDDLIDLARHSQAVTVHLALTPETEGILGREFFQALPPGAFFINTSRAEVADREALLEALEGGLRAGLDVFHGEPGAKEGPIEDPVALHPNCYGTHHIGASTDQAERATGAEAVAVARAFLAGEPIPNCVNLRPAPRGSHALVVRHQDRVGVLAGVFDVLKRAGLNVQEMENQVFSGARAACARILLDSPVPPEVERDLRSCEGVLHVTATGP